MEEFLKTHNAYVDSNDNGTTLEYLDSEWWVYKRYGFWNDKKLVFYKGNSYNDALKILSLPSDQLKVITTIKEW